MDFGLHAMPVLPYLLLMGSLTLNTTDLGLEYGWAVMWSEWLQAAGLADTAIELCILLKRADTLWEDIYPRYLERKQQGILVDRLLPHILASKLPSFPPEVMQASKVDIPSKHAHT